MVNYKLYYFDIRGAGEVARMIFHFANVPFEDSRISQDDWPKIKPSTPTGKLPYLEVDGKQLPESGAIFRFLARKYNLVSPDDWDNAQMESAVDYFKDFLMDIRPFFMVSLGRAEGDKDQLYKNTYLPAAEKVYGRLGEICEEQALAKATKAKARTSAASLSFHTIQRIVFYFFSFLLSRKSKAVVSFYFLFN